MPTKANPDLLLAQTLAAPFTPCSQGNVLSQRRLPDGGMVVIAADGRKLWFNAEEVAAACDMLEAQARQSSSSRVKTPVKLPASTANQSQVNHDHSGNS